MKYKVEIFRCVNVIYATKDLENHLNELSKDGWIVIHIEYLPTFSCYQIIFEKEITNG